MSTPNNLPYFSIIIPTYNRGHLIRKTLDSVLAQNDVDFEVIVVDDGSKDNTEIVVSAFSDARVRYFKKENGERGAARNYGRQVAKGKYITFFDSDDLMYSNHLQVARQMIRDYHEPEFFHLGYDYKTPDGRVTRNVNTMNESVKEILKFDNVLSCNGVFLRKDIADEFPFEEARELASAEDWHLWIRLSSRFLLRYSNEITTSVVNHDQRSLFTIAADKIIRRDMMLMETLKQDKVALASYGRSFKKFEAERYTFFMLCLSRQKRRAEVMRWAMLSVWTYPPIMFSKRFLASLKNSFV